MTLSFAHRIDQAYLCDLVTRMSSVGSHASGFRAAGTPEEWEVNDLVAAEMRSIGLQDVHVEYVPVDGWRFLGASVTTSDGRLFECASMGGVPGTSRDGVRGEFVFVGDARTERLDRVDLTGRIVLVDWRRQWLKPSSPALELALRGAAGVIVTCLEGGPYFQSPGVVGSFDGGWHSQSPPMVTMSKEDAHVLIGTRPSEVYLKLAVELTPASPAGNVVGVLPGRTRGAPIVVGAHHDAWFHGAFDNATGVAAILAIARSLAESHYQPTHPIWFVSHTAEEYGIADSPFGWCWGAWHQISQTHRRWSASVPFFLDVEASGHPRCRLLVGAPVELHRFARRICRQAANAGLLRSGWRLGLPVTGTHAWPFLLTGVPSMSVYTWEREFARTDYHTPNDTVGILDFDHLASLCKVYATMLCEADQQGERILDHGARSRDVIRSAAALPADTTRLRTAGVQHGARRGRAPFTPIGRSLFAVDAHGDTGYPYQQAARDVAQLDAALGHLRRGVHGAAVRALLRVGDNRLHPYLSREALAVYRARRTDPARASWGAYSHLTQSPDLRPELASLRGEPGSRPVGPWIERSLVRHRHAMQRQLQRRLENAANVLTAAGR